MNCLVTGGAGFIGSHVVECLLEQGVRVSVLDDLSSGRRRNLAGLDVRFVRGDVRDADCVRAALEGVDTVIHLAAVCSVARSLEDPVGTHDVNASGTVVVLDACRRAGVRRVVFASSSAVYGDSPELPKREEMTPAPLSAYAAAKLAGEHYCRMFWKTYGLETVCLRFFNVFGPRQDPASEYAAVIPRFIHSALRGDRPVLYGDGSQSRDFVYVGDVARAVMLAATRPGVAGAVVNIAGGARRSLLDLLDGIGGILGRRLNPEMRDFRPGDVRHSQAATAEARRLLGFSPHVGFTEGLEQTFAWFADLGRPPVAVASRQSFKDHWQSLPS